jgi:hypothetical protein
MSFENKLGPGTVVVESDLARRDDDMDTMASFAESMGWIKPLNSISGGDPYFMKTSLVHHAPASATTGGNVQFEIKYIVFDAGEAVRSINELILGGKIPIVSAGLGAAGNRDDTLAVFTKGEPGRLARVVVTESGRGGSTAKLLPRKTLTMSRYEKIEYAMSGSRFGSSFGGGGGGSGESTFPLAPAVDAHGRLSGPCVCTSTYSTDIVRNFTFSSAVRVKVCPPPGWKPVSCKIVRSDYVLAMSSQPANVDGQGKGGKSSYVFTLTDPSDLDASSSSKGHAEGKGQVEHPPVVLCVQGSIYNLGDTITMDWEITDDDGRLPYAMSATPPCIKIESTGYRFFHLTDYDVEKIWKLPKQIPDASDPRGFRISATESVYTGGCFAAERADEIDESLKDSVTYTTFKKWFSAIDDDDDKK